MSQTVSPHLPPLEAVGPDELCDSCSVARARVAIYLRLHSGEAARFVFCAHHFAIIDTDLKDRVIAKRETELD